MAVDERALQARQRAETNVPRTLRYVMVERWGKVNYSELSRRADVPISTVRNHVRGKNSPPADELAAYAGALSVPTWLLFHGPDEAIAWMRDHADDAIPGWVDSSSLAAYCPLCQDRRVVGRLTQARWSPMRRRYSPRRPRWQRRSTPQAT